MSKLKNSDKYWINYNKLHISELFCFPGLAELNTTQPVPERVFREGGAG